MSTIIAIIERGPDGGFTIHAPEIKGVYAPAPTEKEAKEEFVEMLHEQAEFIEERSGSLPDWYNEGNFDIDYTYSISGFFEAFPFINASKFAQAIGVNPSLMRRYKSGQSGVSAKQKAAMQAKFAAIVSSLNEVHF